MVDLPRKKVGIVACSGEELPEGTVTRLAALKVLEQMRPGATVTICLPLFLAGGEGDRAFAKFYPTISVDGCELRCAARATEMYSNKPAASLIVRDLIAENQLGKPEGKRHLNEAGLKAAQVTAERIAVEVDTLLEKRWNRRQGELIQLETIDVLQEQATPEHVISTCACGSGIPIETMLIGDEKITLVGIPLIFQQFLEAKKNPTVANLDELMEIVKVYNAIPAEKEKLYLEVITLAYSKFWFKGKG